MTVEEFIKLTTPNTRRKPRHIESMIQSSCVSWFRINYPEYLILSIPNGGSRNRIEAANLKKEGALAGASDLLVIGKGKVLFVEMKSEKGRQQDSQKDFQRNVERLGHKYRVCRSLGEFISVVEKWIEETR